MAARRRSHRRWLVRRRRFQVAHGWQVTDTWLNIPFLPRRIVSYRKPEGRPAWGHIYSDVPPAGCDALFGGVVVVVLVASIVHDVTTGQLVARIPDYLTLLVGLCILAVLMWQATRHPE